jgi:hypothetical protein
MERAVASLLGSLGAFTSPTRETAIRTSLVAMAKVAVAVPFAPRTAEGSATPTARQSCEPAEDDIRNG